MDTGSGKTLIAILLVRHIFDLSRRSTAPGSDTSAPAKKKLIVFIVPTVALVAQQSTVIGEQTDLVVKPLVGSMGIDFWKMEKWIQELEQGDIVVCTAQIWLNALQNAYWSIDRVSFI